MNERLKSIVAQILHSYPEKAHLSNARVTKMVYLVDWLFAVRHGKTASSIRWFFDNYGPFVWDIKDTAVKHPGTFQIIADQTPFGSDKTRIDLQPRAQWTAVEPPLANIINEVITKTRTKSWNEFIQLVYSTYPVTSSPKYSYLDLQKKAAELRAMHS